MYTEYTHKLKQTNKKEKRSKTRTKGGNYLSLGSHIHYINCIPYIYIMVDEDREKKKNPDQIDVPIGLLYYVGVWKDVCMHAQRTRTKLALQWDP